MLLTRPPIKKPRRARVRDGATIANSSPYCSTNVVATLVFLSAISGTALTLAPLGSVKAVAVLSMLPPAGTTTSSGFPATVSLPLTPAIATSSLRVYQNLYWALNVMVRSVPGDTHTWL